MITRRTRIQLIAFVIITLLGVSFVGARYARLDRLVRDDAYTVQAHFADSGGIFAGGEVTYRGVGVGTVDKLVLTEDGVDVYLAIQNKWDEIPTDSMALVGNRSAVGEQYVELQPQTDAGPYLENDSEIARDMTAIPIQTDELLTNLSDTVSSVDQGALRTTVDELGDAFIGTGDDLQTILDTGSAFINEADRNFDVTERLISDGNIVLDGQLASESCLAHVRRAALALQRHAGRRRPRPAQGHRRRLRSPPTSCAGSSRTTASSWARSSTTWSRPARSSSRTCRASSRCW